MLHLIYYNHLSCKLINTVIDSANHINENGQFIVFHIHCARHISLSLFFSILLSNEKKIMGLDSFI